MAKEMNGSKKPKPPSKMQNELAYQNSSNGTSGNGSVMTKDEKKQKRIEHGYCVECEGPPILLYHIEKRGGMLKKKARSARGQCGGGVCFVCHPNSDPSTSETHSSVLQQDLAESGVATVLSIDQWKATKESKCDFPQDPSLGVNFICMHPEDKSHITKTPNPKEGARYKEIYIDLVGMLYAINDAGSRHVLDDRFDSFLGPGEKAFKDSLIKFMQDQNKEAKSTRAYSYLEKTLRDKMGYRNVFGWANRAARSIVSYYGMDESLLTAKGTKSSKGGKMKLRQASCVKENVGHVFVCNASVCDIQCDAFLCPGAISLEKHSVNGSIFNQWWSQGVDGWKSYLGTSSLKTHEGFDRVVTFFNWPQDAKFPLFIAGEVPLEAQMEQLKTKRSTASESSEELRVEFLLETVRQFLELATSLVRRRKPFVKRERYLLAVPVLGTGGGYAGDMTGQIVDGLLNRLNEFVAAQPDVDVVIVTADDATYAHAQAIRYNGYMSGNGSTSYYTPHQCPCFHKLSLRQQQSASQLARLASNRHLALFVGAGVSMGSGLPGWLDLLQIVEDAFTPSGDRTERSIGDKCQWDPVQMAEELDTICKAQDDRSGIRMGLKQRVCKYMSENGRHPGLLLSLLMSLPFHSIVTQNYDNLIEKACQKWNVALRYTPDAASKTKRNLSIIPYRPRRNAQYWLLKMHGCVSVPNDIILTKADYDSYPTSRRSQALDGLVQASLLTKHLLFVGFSLTDPNYLRIIDQVRDALYIDTGKENSHPAV
eukprot:scaffold1004_cov105-Cylindrotheca_fusiformis.AAC.8